MGQYNKKRLRKISAEKMCDGQIPPERFPVGPISTQNIFIAENYWNSGSSNTEGQTL